MYLLPILDAGGRSLNQLPTMRRYTTRNRGNNICFNHMLGVCPAGRGCKFDHVPRDEINDAFCRRVIEVLEPGIEKVFQQGPAPWARCRPNNRQRGE